MSSGFVSEKELEERRKKRQEEWEKVRRPDQPLEAPEEEYDHRSLYERLQEQKMKKDTEYEEAHKLKNMIRGLDDDEVDFLDLVDKTRLDEEKQRALEEKQALQEMKDTVIKIQQNVAQSEDLKRKSDGSKQTQSEPSVGLGSTSQTKLLANVIKRKSTEKNEPVKKKKSNDDQNKSETTGSESKELNKNQDTTPLTATSSESETDQNSAMKCVAILPGIGNYKHSSDSEQSTDSSDDDSPPRPAKHIVKYDLCGRAFDIKQSHSH